MATSSFRTPLVIKDDKAADAIIRAMEKPSVLNNFGKSGFPEALQRGSELLKRLYSD
jgi:hypothetical protein